MGWRSSYQWLCGSWWHVCYQKISNKRTPGPCQPPKSLQSFPKSPIPATTSIIHYNFQAHSIVCWEETYVKVTFGNVPKPSKSGDGPFSYVIWRFVSWITRPQDYVYLLASLHLFNPQPFSLQYYKKRKLNPLRLKYDKWYNCFQYDVTYLVVVWERDNTGRWLQ